MSAMDRDPETFADELAALKRRGCAILVVGPDGGPSRCGDLLGADDRGRERLVVDASHAHGVDGSSIHAGAPDLRSAVAHAPGEAPGADAPDLDAITTDLIDRIDRLDAGSLDPGELRVCFGDLSALDPGDGDALVSFLETVADRVRGAAGMGHGHLPDTSPLRAAVEPLFDVTVEVRPAPGGREQRWLLHDAGLDSGWIAVEE
jgi:hypothetical protein